MKDLTKTENLEKFPKRNGSVWVVILCAVILAGGTVYVGYKIGNDKVTNLTRQKVMLTAHVNAIQKKTQQQTEINNGTAASNDTYVDPNGGLGLVDGKIIFTMPGNWVREPSNNCSTASIASTVLCYDTAEIMPKDQSKKSEDPNWNANISVFQYKNSDGTARQWFEKYYNGGPLTNTGIPKDQNINVDDIAGNSALIFQSTEEGAYVNGLYVVVHGSYAVVINTQLQYGAVYGTYPGAQPYDYQKTYGPILQQFLNSVKFKDK